MNSNAVAQAPLLEASDLHLRLGHHDALRGVNISLRPGEVQFIMGPSGCGKSSLLRCLNFLERPTSGSIAFKGEAVGFRQALFSQRWTSGLSLRDYRRAVGMVFQGFNIWQHLSVRDNLLLPLERIKGISQPASLIRARELLDLVGLSDKENAIPSQLSGGQLQRLSIARSLTVDPALLLLDEPTSSLDPELVQGVLELIRKLAGAGMTMLIVTHEAGLARALGNRLIFMDQGTIVEEGVPADLIDRPKSARMRAFLGTIFHQLDPNARSG